MAFIISKAGQLGTDVMAARMPRFTAPASFLRPKSFMVFYLAFIFGLLLVQTATAQEFISSGSCRRCVKDYDPNTDYFPKKVSADHSVDWSVTYFKHYKVIENKQATNGIRIFYAYLCGTPKPQVPNANAVAIEMPIRNYVLTSSTHFGYFEQIAQLEGLVGYASAGIYLQDTGLTCTETLSTDTSIAFQDDYFAFNDQPELNAWFLDITSEGGNYPQSGLDAIFVDPFAANFGRYNLVPSTSKDNAQVIEVSEIQSNTVIQHAEWVEFVAAFFNKESIAENIVARSKSFYDCHKSKVNTALPKKKVLLINSCFLGSYQLGRVSNEYYNGLIADANGQMFLGTTINPGYSDRVTEAEYLQHFSNVANAQDIVIVLDDANSCNVSLPAFAQAKIFGLQTAPGRNKWFSSRFIMPDRVLQEFISMIQPTGSDPSRIMFSQVQPNLNNADVSSPSLPQCNLNVQFDERTFSRTCDANVPAAPADITNLAAALCDSPGAIAALSPMLYAISALIIAILV